MAFNFPNFPLQDEIYESEDGYSFQWDGEKWISMGTGNPLNHAPASLRILRTDVPNKAPAFLAPGELAIEMASTPVKLWVGVPNAIDAKGMKILLPQGSVIVQDGSPIFPPQGTLWWESDTGILWMWYNDKSSSQWVQVNGSGGDGDLVSAGGMAYAGLQVNGAMEVSQEHGLTPVPAVRNYVVDAWKVEGAGTLVVTGEQSTDAPVGFINSLKVSVTTANPILVAGDMAVIYTPIEGYRAARLAWGTTSAQPITLTFWCKTHRPGDYSFVVKNKLADRNFAVVFTQAVADEWEYQTFTIPGDTLGVWEKTNQTSIYLMFTMACDPALCIAPQVWSETSAAGAVGTINGAGDITDTMQITGVLLLPGVESPSYTRSALAMRPYDQELVTCKRYWQKLPTYQFNSYGVTGTNVAQAIWFSEMRDIPNVLLTDMASTGVSTTPNVTEPSSKGFTTYRAVLVDGMTIWRESAILDARLT